MLLPTARYWGITDILPTHGPAFSPLNDTFERRPAQEPTCPKDEAPYDDLVLVAVPLKTHSHDILLLGVFAEADALAEAERLGALGAG